MAKMRIKELRERIGMSQASLADKLPVRQPGVCAWEKGNATPSTDMLPLLAETLGWTIDELFDKKEVS